MNDNEIIEMLTMQNFDLQQSLDQEKAKSQELRQRLEETKNEFQQKFQALLLENEKLETKLNEKSYQSIGEQNSQEKTTFTEPIIGADKSIITNVICNVYKREIMRLSQLIQQILILLDVKSSLHTLCRQETELVNSDTNVDQFLQVFSGIEGENEVFYKIGSYLLLNKLIYSCPNIQKGLICEVFDSKQLFCRLKQAKQMPNFELELFALDKQYESCTISNSSFGDVNLYALSIEKYETALSELQHALRINEKRRIERLETQLHDSEYKTEILQAKIDKLVEKAQQAEKSRLMQSFKSTLMARASSKQESPSGQRGGDSRNVSFELFQMKHELHKTYQRCHRYMERGNEFETCQLSGARQAIKHKYERFNKLTDKVFLFLAQ